ncbi:MAG: alpha/beta hydrolase [Chitinophagaceae bacterium]
MRAYFISGLGADKKAFYKIKLPEGFEPVYLDWISPLYKESLKEYALRFSSLIQTDEDFILIGLSLGGMIASEIARIKTPRKVILLSSISASVEMPWYFRMAGKMKIQKVVPIGLYKHVTLLNHFMGSKSKNDKAMVRSFVEQTDPAFIQWAIDAILNWKQEQRLENIVHIHGDKDRLLPVKYTNADHIIQNGKHLMILNKSDEINEVLAEILSTDQLSNN